MVIGVIVWKYGAKEESKEQAKEEHNTTEKEIEERKKRAQEIADQQAKAKEEAQLKSVALALQALENELKEFVMQKRQRESEEAMEEDIKFDTDVLIKMDQELDKMRRIEEETRQATNQALLLEQEEFILQQEESLARAQTQNELMGALFDIQNQPETGGIDLALQPTRDSPLPKSILPARKSITRRQDNVGELRRVTQPAWTFDAPPDVSPEGDPEVQRRMTLEELAQAAQNQLEEMENREFEKAQNDTKAIEMLKNSKILSLVLLTKFVLVCTRTSLAVFTARDGIDFGDFSISTKHILQFPAIDNDSL